MIVWWDYLWAVGLILMLLVLAQWLADVLAQSGML